MNAYQILGVSATAPQKEIEQAYQTLVRRYGVFTTPSNVERFVAINAAYAVLSNAETRRRHDQRSALVPVAQSSRSTNAQSPQRRDAVASAPEPMGQPRSYPVQAPQVTVHNHLHFPTQTDGVNWTGVLIGWGVFMAIFGGIVLSL